ALLQSTLECFYQYECFHQLVLYMNYGYLINTTLLDSSINSKYQTNSIVADLVSQLMVEQWNPNVSYDQYYQQCQPKQCTYTYVQQFVLTYIIATILGIFGGLTAVLRIIIPPTVKFIRKKKTTTTTGKQSYSLSFGLRLRKIRSTSEIY
ncbi:unnamed protein product, partial [Didymodactylos carnosus]